MKIYLWIGNKCLSVYIFNYIVSVEITGTIAINYPPNQPYITGKVLDGVMVKLENVNKKGIGRLAVKSKGLFPGYWNQKEVCRGYYLTGDLVKMVGKNMILILGRCNDIVSISGLKVNIKEVENIILKYSKVRECLVSKRENSAFGECLEAITFQLKRASGPIDSRKKLALVLERNADIWNCNCLAQHYMKLSDQWEIFSNLLFKYCKTGNKKVKKRIMIRLGYIFQLEEEGSNSLEILVNTL